MASILSQTEINAIISDISAIIGDDVISTDVVYKLSGSTVSMYDPTDGLIPEMWTSSSVSAFKGSYSIDEVNKSGGLIELEDVKFIIMTSAVCSILSVDDMIIEDSSIYQSATTYSIKSVKRDPLSICYFLQTRLGNYE